MRPLHRSLRPTVAALIAILVGSIALAVASAAPAGAHAVVVSSSPSADARLSAPPSEVSIVFSEAVTSDLGGITVLDSDGNRVDNDDSAQPSATTLRTTLQPDLGDGTYVANYKVVSADGHPISGAIVFGVGDAQLGDVSGLAVTGDPGTERLGAVARFLTYAAALLAAGLAFFLAFVHDGAGDRRRMGTVVQIATVVAAIGAALTLAVQASLATGEGLGAVFQVDVLRGVLREGLGWQTALLFVGLALCHIAAAARPSVGAQGMAFYGALAVTSSFVFWGHAREAPNLWLSIAADLVHVAVAALWFGGVVGLTMTLRTRIRTARDAGLHEPTLVVEPRPAGARPLGDGDHDEARAQASGPAAAASGAPTATAVLDRPGEDEQASTGGRDADPDHPTRDAGTGRGDDGPEPAARGSLPSTVAIVRRFSTSAAISVIVLAVSGTVLAWQEVGSFEALTATGYGQTLLVKLGLVAVVLVLAGYNRFFLLPWLLAEPAAPGTGAQHGAGEPAGDEPGEPDADRVAEGVAAGWRTLVRTVTAEAVVLVAVLAVTAVLVNVVPGRTGEAATGPFAQTQPFRSGQVSLTVTPNQPGVNSFHVDFIGPDGRPADLAQKVTLELRLPAKDIGPLQRDMVKAGVGHFLLEGLSDVSIAGTWEITLTVRVSDFDQERVTFTDEVG